ncbi:hypothetical protein MJ004_12900 [Acinetobacter junii]|uniref:hypothetical protein n=1 Tax=Acinetobacter junii TaxID=40215 RepID=UPI0022EA4BE8|nr:hypothetical protein [Acinetobacter junii]MDA3509289.1 hypothetical protein [Acinetobacter junii]MDA3533588.1 hypothetical protein [Acinetobacter junii]
MNTSNIPEHKQTQSIQSWYEPALRTLNDFLEVRKANLRKINRDEANAAVTRDELIEALSREHRMSYHDAGMIISSLHRADKIIMFGRFIQVNEKDGEE